MISTIVSRLVILVFGTLYPAYASYKAVRTKNVKEYVKWMMYWIVFALFTCAETFTDVFLSWFPFYYEIKIILVLWLLSPATKGSSILYRKFVHPMLSRREQEIDDYIAKAKEQGYHTVLNLGTKGVNYATTVIMQTAIKGGGGLVNQLRKSYSLSDLTDGADSRADSRGLQENLDDSSDVIDPRHLRRRHSPRRSASGSSRVDMYFPEVDVRPGPSLGHVRSTEDVSSGYSSAEPLYVGQPPKLEAREGLIRTASVGGTSRSRTRTTRTSLATKKAPLPEDSEDSESESDPETVVVYFPKHASPRQIQQAVIQEESDSSENNTEFVDSIGFPSHTPDLDPIKNEISETPIDLSLQISEIKHNIEAICNVELQITPEKSPVEELAQNRSHFKLQEENPQIDTSEKKHEASQRAELAKRPDTLEYFIKKTEESSKRSGELTIHTSQHSSRTQEESEAKCSVVQRGGKYKKQTAPLPPKPPEVAQKDPPEIFFKSGSSLTAEKTEETPLQGVIHTKAPKAHDRSEEALPLSELLEDPPETCFKSGSDLVAVKTEDRTLQGGKSPVVFTKSPKTYDRSEEALSPSELLEDPPETCFKSGSDLVAVKTEDGSLQGVKSPVVFSRAPKTHDRSEEITRQLLEDSPETCFKSGPDLVAVKTEDRTLQGAKSLVVFSKAPKAQDRSEEVLLHSSGAKSSHTEMTRQLLEDPLETCFKSGPDLVKTEDATLQGVILTKDERSEEAFLRSSEAKSALREACPPRTTEAGIQASVSKTTISEKVKNEESHFSTPDQTEETFFQALENSPSSPEGNEETFFEALGSQNTTPETPKQPTSASLQSSAMESVQEAAKKVDSLSGLKRTDPTNSASREEKEESAAAPIKATLVLKPGIIKSIGPPNEDSSKTEVFVSHSPKPKRKSHKSKNESPISRLMMLPKKIFGHKESSSSKEMLKPSKESPKLDLRQRKSWHEETRSLTPSSTEETIKSKSDTEGSLEFLPIVEDRKSSSDAAIDKKFEENKMVLRTLSHSPKQYRRRTINYDYEDSD